MIPIPPKSSRLDYQQTAARGSGRWAVASVWVGVGSIVLGAALPAAAGFLRGVATPANARAVVYVAFVAVVIVGPAVGITLGGIGLRPSLRRRGLALFGILLNLVLWAAVLLLLLSQKR